MDERLSLIYDMTPPCRLAADIGADHGYLICALVASGRAERGIAADIRPLPLDKARKEAEGRGLSDRIRLVLGDGLAGVDPDGLEVAVIAGMGGETVARIMGEWPFSKNPGLLWLLQPMTKAERLRDWLWGEGFSITRERCCLAAGRVYSVMAVRYTGGNSPHPEWERHLGKVDPGEDEYSFLYAEKKAEELEKIAAGIEAGGDAPQAEKLKQIARRIRERMEGKL